MSGGMSRTAFYGELGFISVVEPLIANAYAAEEDEIWRSGSEDAPHGHPWHTCLAGATEVVTRQGIKPIQDLVGEAEILVPEQHQSSRGCFKKVVVENFGDRQVFEVELVRNRQSKKIFTTPEHRWYLDDGSEVVTENLIAGMALKGIVATWREGADDVPFAIAQGFVFGDGTTRKEGRSNHLVIHHNGKDEGIVKFFHGHRMISRQRTDTGMNVTEVRGLPTLWKELPDLRESRPFLLSWLAGYFAADGCVGEQGQCILSSASREAIDFARDVAAICGIGYGQVRTNSQSGKYPQGGAYEDRIIYQLTLTAKDLPRFFFVLPKHLNRIDAFSDKRMETRIWKVKSVTPAHRENVYCATVPGRLSFGLADGLLTGNSFHASEFPGDDPYACGRKAVYGLLGPPPSEPITPHLRAWFDLGKNLELDWVRRWAYYGVLLSADQNADDDVQTGFQDPRYWLTGSSDAIVLPPFWNKGHCVEVKTTSHEKVQMMLQGGEPPKKHEKYKKQLAAYIGLACESQFAPTVMICGKSGIMMIPDINGCREKFNHGGSCTPRLVKLLPPDDGTLIYSSREEPMTTVSFYQTYDAELMAAGRAKLREWQQAFLENRIPEHPRDKEKAKWSVDPCSDCAFKKFVCKPDYTKKVTDLNVSALREYGSTIRNDYDFDARKASVLARWMTEEAQAA